VSVTAWLFLYREVLELPMAASLEHVAPTPQLLAQ
jgi:hypothetical protein